MVYDAARREIVLFGGYGNGSYFSDTWTWDGTNWEQETPSIAPSGRVDAAIAYDPVNARVVLFSGGAANDPGADTWSWNGHNWTRVQPALSPPGRQGGVMTYDSARKKLVMVGSVTGEPSTLIPWVLNGSNWMQLHPATADVPPRRYGPFVGSLGDSGQVVVFGGLGASDMWIWDGAKWKSVVPPNSPSPRGGGMQTATPMAYDSCHDELVLFSGQGPSGWMTDTWTFDGTTWTRRG